MISIPLKEEWLADQLMYLVNRLREAEEHYNDERSANDTLYRQLHKLQDENNELRKKIEEAE